MPFYKNQVHKFGGFIFYLMRCTMCALRITAHQQPFGIIKNALASML